MFLKQQISIAKICAIINRDISCVTTGYNKQY